jgi:bacterioferritin
MMFSKALFWLLPETLAQNKFKGAEYGDIAEQLKKHASQELAHALEVAKQIDYLGADPTVKHLND